MKKKSLTLLSAAIASLVLSACGGSGGGDTPPSPPPGPGGDTYVNVPFVEAAQSIGYKFLPFDGNVTINVKVNDLTASIKIDDGDIEYSFSDSYIKAIDNSFALKDRYEMIKDYPYLHVENFSFMESYVEGYKLIGIDLYQVEQIENFFYTSFAELFSFGNFASYMHNCAHSPEHMGDEPDVQYDVDKNTYYFPNCDTTVYFNDEKQITKIEWEGFTEHSGKVKTTITYSDYKTTHVELPTNVEVKTGFEFEYRENEGGYVIIGGHALDYAKETVVPMTHEGKPVVAIDVPWNVYFGFPLLTIGSNIKYFHVTNYQIRVTLLSNETKLEYSEYASEIIRPGETSEISVIDGCAIKTDKVTGEKTLISLLDNDKCSFYDFYYDEAIQDNIDRLKIPGEYTRIDRRLLKFVNQINDIEFLEGIKYIEAIDFTYVDNVSLPNSLIYLEENFSYPYRDYSKIFETCTVIDGLYYLGNKNNPYVALVYKDKTFNDDSLTLPDTCYVVGAYVFDGYYNLRTLIAPHTKGFMESSFIGNYLTTLSLGSDYLYLGNNCFNFESNIDFTFEATEIEFNNHISLPQVSKYMTTDDNGLVYMGNEHNPHMILINISDECTNFAIHSECKYIGGLPEKYYIESLKDISIPSSVKKIANRAFVGDAYDIIRVTANTEFDVLYSFGEQVTLRISGEHRKYIDDNGNIYNHSKTWLYRVNHHQSSLTLPDTLLGAANEYNFDSDSQFFKGVSSVYYPGDISSWMELSILANKPFDLYLNNSKLETVELEGEINSYVFSGITSIKKVIIGEKETSIGQEVFTNCKNLKELVISSSGEEVHLDGFENTGLKELNIPERVSSINGFDDNNQLVKVILNGPADGYLPFEGCRHIALFVNNSGRSRSDLGLEYNIIDYIENDVPTSQIKEENGFTLLYKDEEVWLVKVEVEDGTTTINIPEGVTDIASYALELEDGFGPVTINVPSSVKHIASYAFEAHWTSSGSTINMAKEERYYELEDNWRNYYFVVNYKEHEHVWSDWVITSNPFSSTTIALDTENSYYIEKERQCEICEEYENESIEVKAVVGTRTQFLSYIDNTFDIPTLDSCFMVSHTLWDGSLPPAPESDTAAKGSAKFDEYYNEWFVADESVLAGLEAKYGDNLKYIVAVDSDGNIYAANIRIYTSPTAYTIWLFGANGTIDTGYNFAIQTGYSDHKGSEGVVFSYSSQNM